MIANLHPVVLICNSAGITNAEIIRTSGFLLNDNFHICLNFFLKSFCRIKIKSYLCSRFKNQTLFTSKSKSKMNTQRLINENGRPVANHYVINEKGKTYLQSYYSVVACINPLAKRKITLSSDWDYSNTTRKYLYTFLRQNGFDVRKIDQVRELIKLKKIVVKKDDSLLI